ncbi:MAG: citrate synthase [Acidobacteria bacterium]|nr:citrate synthase [Acidobacteriota bacterium]MBI3658404.1 citrate synthase [Acidobacteriota bacterium]
MSGSRLVFKEGLEDIVATASDICYIDGEQGVLSYRGYDIHDLALGTSFEEVAHLLWFGKFPSRAELGQLRAAIAAERNLPMDLLALMSSQMRSALPMDVLRTVTSMLSMYDSDLSNNSYEANVRRSLRLLAQFTTIIAAFDRLRKGLEVVPPRPDLDHAANFLYMLTGKVPDSTSARGLDIALVLHADHELNASTFAARVTASTLTDMYSAITSGIGALKGPLHGGANEAVMRMLLEIEQPDRVERYLRDAFAQKRKIPGFGHRVYRTEDPRATHLRQMSKELGEQTGHVKLFQISRQIEEIVKWEKGLNCNVDFYSGSVYYMLGIAIDLFTPVFAISRISGWTAHVLEQLKHNRLIRPRAEYTGLPYPQKLAPLEQR